MTMRTMMLAALLAWGAAGCAMTGGGEGELRARAAAPSAPPAAARPASTGTQL